MTFDQTIRLMTSITALLGVLIWPTLIVFLVIRLRRPLSRFFDNIGELTLSAPGLEATARRQQTEAAAALGAASTKRSDSDTAPTTNLAKIAEAVLDAAPDQQAQRRLRDSLVLWVDDHPEHNSYEKRALEAFGVRFAICTSTDEALDRLRHQTFDLIISDMSRPPDQKAGLTLLDMLRGEGDRTPVVIYAGSGSPEHVEEARRHGALGYTNSPHELILMVAQTLTEVSPSRSTRHPVRRFAARARADS